MPSKALAINNPACVITKAQSQTANLPIIAPSDTPSLSEVFELEVDTQDTFYPSLKRDVISITGLTSYDNDEFNLYQLKPDNSEGIITESEVTMERSDPSYRTFNAKLFFRSKRESDYYPPNQITAQATVTLECKS